MVHDSGQKCAEQATLLRIQWPQQGVGGVGKSCGSLPLRSLSFAGQVDQERAAVVRVAHPLHQSALLELVDQVDHRCPVDGQGRGQFDLGQRPGLGKRAEDPQPRADSPSGCSCSVARVCAVCVATNNSRPIRSVRPLELAACVIVVLMTLSNEATGQQLLCVVIGQLG